MRGERVPRGGQRVASNIALPIDRFPWCTTRSIMPVTWSFSIVPSKRNFRGGCIATQTGPHRLTLKRTRHGAKGLRPLIRGLGFARNPGLVLRATGDRIRANKATQRKMEALPLPVAQTGALRVGWRRFRHHPGIDWVGAAQHLTQQFRPSASRRD